MLRFGPAYMWFAFLAIPLLLLLFWYAAKARKRSLAEFGDAELVSMLTNSVSPQRRRLKRILLIIAFIFLGIGLVAPKIGTSLTEVKRRGINIILALDTSLSMKAEDVKPSRLRRAKYEASQLIDKLRGDRVGLVAFAGVAYLQSPLTLDYRAARMFLDVMDTDMIPSQGTAIGEAINMALKSFDVEKHKYKALVIFSDGEDHLGKAIEAAQKAAKDGVVIYTVGVGSISGSPIPMADDDGNSGFKRDRQGKVVTTKLDPSILQQIASITGGKYYQMNTGDYSAKELYDNIFKLDKTELSSHQYSNYEERYQYFIAVAFLLFLVETFIPDRKMPESKRSVIVQKRPVEEKP